MDSIDRTASQHERRAATWLVTGVAVSLATGLTLGFGFDIHDTPAPLLAWVGSWGAAWHLYHGARLKGQRAWLYGGLAVLGPVPALMVHMWLRRT
ncbi:hypothetical protein [Stenotrophomonas sp.]|uniref:hypothetical protein n=1 Tax=Stenotrophomonas sp. TaxID=69392 RepID=UPI0028A661BF|nr:hypothetical protein [Stenotrophomonas sp.]